MDQEQTKSEYLRDGYVALRGFSPPEELVVLLEQLNRFISEVVPGMPPEHVFYEDKNNLTTLKQLQQMGTYDSWFNERFTSGPFREIAEVLLHGPVIPKNL